MLRYVLTGGAALLLGSAAAAPLLADEPAESLFSQLDSNEDGRLTADEVSEEQKRFFDRLLRVGDGNEDGVLTLDEFEAATSETDRPVTSPQSGGRRGGLDPETLFRQLDRDGDRKLTLSELPERAQERMRPLFERLDKDELTYEEFSGAMRPQGGRPGGGDNPAGRMQFLKRLDRNGDGKISIDEIPEQAQGRLQPLFDRLGTDEIDLARLEEFAGGNRPDQPGRPRPERPGQGRPDQPRSRPQPGGGPVFLQVVDQNGDGRISRDELAKASEQFDRLDRNEDGQLEPRELFGGGDMGPGDRMAADGRRRDADAPSRPRRPGDASDAPGGSRDRAAMFRQIDSDGDGYISRSEAPSRLNDERFSQLDANNDGKLSKEEAARLFQRPGRPGQGGDRRLGMQALDRNGDGVLSKDEVPARMRQRFDDIDKDGDGTISKEEFPVRPPQGRARSPKN
ncbi:EF-hand domain-containing protein [Maioricimonas sp. JC845]|uniref:EF-hand domain-containing protein n=1 Tax=Maioricimonas sp. JC845 TaxID=3232138 RepID=UPI003458930E